jgi:hypothetical protein
MPIAADQHGRIPPRRTFQRGIEQSESDPTRRRGWSRTGRPPGRNSRARTCGASVVALPGRGSNLSSKLGRRRLEHRATVGGEAGARSRRWCRATTTRSIPKIQHELPEEQRVARRPRRVHDSRCDEQRGGWRIIRLAWWLSRTSKTGARRAPSSASAQQRAGRRRLPATLLEGQQQHTGADHGEK